MNEQAIFNKLTGSMRFKNNKKTTSKVVSKVVKRPKSVNFFDTLNETVKKQRLEKENGNGEKDEKASLKVARVEEIDYRRKYKIFVEGSDIPDLVPTFEELQKLFKINKTCVANLHNVFKFTNLSPVQMQVIPAMLHRREVMACAPTGSGKTLAFLLPVVHHLLSTRKTSKGFRGLIVCPTRELALQIHQVCNLLLKDGQNCINVQLLDKDTVKACTRKGVKNSKSWDLLISTPNSITYLLSAEKPLICLESVEWLVVDESDKLFEDGKAGRSFREQLGVIYKSCTNPKVRRAVFSATFANDVQQWCEDNMDCLLKVTVQGKNTAVKSVDQSLEYVGNEHGKHLALKKLIQTGFEPPALIFVQSKQRAKDLFAELAYEGLIIDVIHADRTVAQREEAILKFRKAETWMLICTEVLGRGIDIVGCNLVINYDFPTSNVSYIHRIGRTGRAGRRGKAITYFTDEDRPLLRPIANCIKEAGCEVPDYMLSIKKLGKDERKKMKASEVERESLRTTPASTLLKSSKARRKKKNTEEKTDEATAAE